ncbi:shikimate kinase [Mucilaginibacter sp. UR6-11]|uniref:shikimate kinase n=1 Tax=Mucilaginibacter sp. UR6-11 TaxID=1435644 RepID=UPI001E357424|nr:shikimate kinase [Mucilaginibacter sp. UR6-11]MCC8424648.1 AAA family ATPase [Mucilaginibacter sp. UR6-11]
MRIFFIGFMGCGKTTWSRKLANYLGYECLDLDHILEAKAGMSIADYFTQYGQDAFRQLESSILKETDYPENAVVSTGGGLPCFFDNMEWMNTNGQTLYIKLSPKTLAERLDKGKSTRPLIQGLHGDELVAFIAEKLAEREGFYQQATHIVNGIDITVEKLAGIIA